MRFDVSPADLSRQLLTLTRFTHPDYHSLEGEAALALAERNTALLNEAHTTLCDAVLKAEWFLKELGAPSPDAERQMPPAFLLEVLEWNEILELAKTTPGSQDNAQALKQLGDELRRRRENTLEQLGQRLDSTDPGDPLALRQELNSVRYLDRTLDEITQQTLNLDLTTDLTTDR